VHFSFWGAARFHVSATWQPRLLCVTLSAASGGGRYPSTLSSLYYLSPPSISQALSKEVPLRPPLRPTPNPDAILYLANVTIAITKPRRKKNMAVTLKRKRGAVSYREPSSDEDLSGSDNEGLLSRKRAAPVRRSARHQSTEAEQPSPQRRRSASPDSSTRTRATKTRRGSRRGATQRISYLDVSSEDDGDEDFEDEVVEQPRPRMRTNPSPRSHKSNKTGSGPGQPSGRRVRTSLGAPLKPKIGRSLSHWLYARPSDFLQCHP